jgi:hypothetical protein
MKEYRFVMIVEEEDGENAVTKVLHFDNYESALDAQERYAKRVEKEYKSKWDDTYMYYDDYGVFTIRANYDGNMQISKAVIFSNGLKGEDMQICAGDLVCNLMTQSSGKSAKKDEEEYIYVWNWRRVENGCVVKEETTLFKVKDICLKAAKAFIHDEVVYYEEHYTQYTLEHSLNGYEDNLWMEDIVYTDSEKTNYTSSRILVKPLR